jgi:poly(3-hydroxybutyrate) depolymerase
MRSAISICAVLVLATLISAEVVPLPELNLNKDTVTISGISSGGAMAVQMHVAYSSIFKGIGLFASLPYYCAKGALMNAVLCMNAPMMERVDEFAAVAKKYEEAGKIDKLANLAKSKIWLLAGTSDWTVQPKNSRNIEEFYQAVGVKADAISSKYDLPANHAWVNDDKSANSCSTMGSPYINNCNYDGPGELLKHILFTPNKIKSKARTEQKSENLIYYDQTSFGPTSDGLLESGAIYVPTACKKASKKKCHLHVVMHGCDQNTATVGDKFVTKTGLNEWAESNNIVVLYPQAKANFMVMNPKGCWDWWGYSSDLYATKEGPQMKAVAAIVAKLTA